MTHCFHAYTCRIYRCVFRACIWTSKSMGFLSNTMASYSIPVRQVSALLSASFRPLVTETPLPSRYFLPHRRVETVDFHHQQCALSGDRVGGRVTPSASHNTVRAVPHTAFHLNSPHGRQIVQSEPNKQGVRNCYSHMRCPCVVPWASTIIGRFPCVKRI